MLNVHSERELTLFQVTSSASNFATVAGSDFIIPSLNCFSAARTAFSSLGVAKPANAGAESAIRSERERIFIGLYHNKATLKTRAAIFGPNRTSNHLRSKPALAK
jgi:hypothetical protein